MKNRKSWYKSERTHTTPERSIHRCQSAASIVFEERKSRCFMFVELSITTRHSLCSFHPSVYPFECITTARIGELLLFNQSQNFHCNLTKKRTSCWHFFLVFSNKFSLSQFQITFPPSLLTKEVKRLRYGLIIGWKIKVGNQKNQSW